MPEPHAINDQFIRDLTNCQNRLYAYILTLLPDPERARDVLQETNVVLWRKAGEFKTGTNFGAWACKIAYFEVLTERQRRRRDRHVFDEEMIAQLARHTEQRLGRLDDRSLALDECLQQLTRQQRDRLMARYSSGGSVLAMAEELGETPGAVATALYRIRTALLKCIENKLAGSASA